jgi:hypothetical protein
MVAPRGAREHTEYEKLRLHADICFPAGLGTFPGVDQLYATSPYLLNVSSNERHTIMESGCRYQAIWFGQGIIWTKTAPEFCDLFPDTPIRRHLSQNAAWRKRRHADTFSLPGCLRWQSDPRICLDDRGVVFAAMTGS